MTDKAMTICTRIMHGARNINSKIWWTVVIIITLFLIFQLLQYLRDRQGLEQDLELEMQKIWMAEEMQRFENYKRTILKRGNNQKEDSYNPDKKTLEAASKHLWQGLNPFEIQKKWPGIMLDGDYMLKEFVDPLDYRAHGMDNKPKTIRQMTESGAEDRFYQLVTNNHLQCADIRRMGHYGDGGWDLCVSGPYEPKQGCIVYSFGINNDFSFDDAMGQTYGCQVQSFDPSMQQKDHRRSEHVNFKQIGLGTKDVVRHNGWKMMSFSSILEQNGHVDKIIDYLKIDIEFDEWAAFKDLLQSGTFKNVKQLAFEIHTVEISVTSYMNMPYKYNYLEHYNILLDIEKQGFRRYSFHYNLAGKFMSMLTSRLRTFSVELYYININFLKEYQ